jgi:phthiodiolone/phenolphthiodiolone dimycocerosates ketoreductase
VPRSRLSIGTAGTIYPPLERITKNARRAEEKGYASIWWPDHLMGWHPESLWSVDETPLANSITSPHAYIDAVAAIAAASAATEKVLLGTAVTEPIRRHPAMLAQAFLTLSHFSGGRAVLGLGAGEGENIVPYGLDFSKPASKLEEAVEIVRLLWSTNEPVSYEGDHYRLEGAVLGMEPYKGNPPPIWIAAHGPRMLEICGRLGDGWIPTALPLDEFTEKLGRIRAAASEAGRSADEIVAAMFCYCAPATDHESAHRILENRLVKCFCMALDAKRFAKAGYEHPLGPDFYGLVDFKPAGLPREIAIDLVNRIPFEVVHEFIWHGTAAEIYRHATEFAAAGLDHLILWNVSPFDATDSNRQSFAILDEVVQVTSEAS